MKTLLSLLGSLLLVFSLASCGSAPPAQPEPPQEKTVADQTTAQNDEDDDDEDDDAETSRNKPAADRDEAEADEDEPEMADNASKDDADEDEEENDSDNVKAGDDDFTIVGGDVLQITVWKEDGLDREILVLPDGTITFPLIGTLEAKGLTPRMVQDTIKRKLKKFIPDASVTVMVKAPLGHTVSVLGQVTKPGEFVMSHRMGVMQALSEAGGLTPYASESHIIVLRYINGKKTTIEFPYSEIAEGYHLEKDIDLQPGDVVFVATAGLL